MANGRGWRWAVIAMMVALLIGACGGDGDGGGIGVGAGGGDNNGGGGGGNGDAPKIDGCELVTEAEAEDILGEPVKIEENDTPGLQAGGCVYAAAAEDSARLLQLQVYEGEQFYGEDQFKDQEGFEGVDGIGDRAFFMDIAGPTLQVLDGDTFVSLSASLFSLGDDEGPDEATVKTKLKELAKKVLSRL